MRISDWSSDVFSSDLNSRPFFRFEEEDIGKAWTAKSLVTFPAKTRRIPARCVSKWPVFGHGRIPARQNKMFQSLPLVLQIGRASCRERGGHDVSIQVVALSLKKNNQQNEKKVS